MSVMPSSAAARFEFLMDLYAPPVYDDEGVRIGRDPALGMISRESFLALLSWDIVADQQRGVEPFDSDGFCAGFGYGYECGAAVAFGIIGMFTAIRDRCTCPPLVVSWDNVCERCKGYP